MASQSADGEDPVTVGTYRPSEYAEAVWQVVSKEQSSNSFVPAEFKQVRQATYPVDTMFSDFGNVVGSTIELRREEGEFEIQQAQDPGYDLYSSGTLPESQMTEAQRFRRVERLRCLRRLEIQ